MDNLPSIVQAFTDHMDSDEKAFKRITKSLDHIEGNHLSHMEKDIAGLKAGSKTDRAILMIILGSIVAGFFELILRQ